MLNVIEVKDKEYNEMLNKNFSDTRVFFTQLSNYEKVKNDENTYTKKLAVIDDKTGEAIALTIAVYYSLYKFFYKVQLMYGPIVNKDNFYRIGEIAISIKKKIFKNLRVKKLVIDPIIHNNIYEDINITKKNVNEEVKENLEKSGFKRLKQEYYENMEIPLRFFYSKDIEGMNFKDLEKSLVSTLRNRMKKAEKESLKIRYLKRDELNIFNDMLESTYNRVITDQTADLIRLQNLYDEFKDEIYFPVIYIDILQTEEAYLKEKEEKLKEKEKIEEKLKYESLSEKIIKRENNKIKQIDIALKSLEKNIKDIKKLKEEELEKGNKDLKIDIYGGVFIESHNDFIYYLGGGYSKYFGYNAPPKMHKEMMKKALEKNKKVYNLFGISGIFDETAPDAGVIKFKQTFNGYVEELIGTYEYDRYKCLNKLKRGL